MGEALVHFHNTKYGAGYRADFTQERTSDYTDYSYYLISQETEMQGR